MQEKYTMEWRIVSENGVYSVRWCKVDSEDTVVGVPQDTIFESPIYSVILQVFNGVVANFGKPVAMVNSGNKKMLYNGLRGD